LDFARSDCPAVQRQLDRLAALTPPADVLGLERITACSPARRPHRALPPVSTSPGPTAKARPAPSCAPRSRRRAHRHVYTSPHLVRFNERIRLSGKLIEDERSPPCSTKCSASGRHRRAPSSRSPPPPPSSPFRASRRTPADRGGARGRLDATNVIERPAICGIAHLGLDHQAFLGTPSRRAPRKRPAVAKNGVRSSLSSTRPGGA
jgi:dihydrofolate synthase/folylpolyglutamate synthase